MHWFDTHVHLDRYPAAERAAVLARARAAGVARLLAVSTDCASSRRVAALPDGVLKAVGVHPLRTAGGICAELAGLAGRPGVVAIGEAGFDGAGPPFAVQGAAFRAQCDLARRLNLALVLHVAGAWQAFMVAIAAEDSLAGLRVVRHYFTGDAAQAAWHVARGHWLSFGRPLLREPALQQIARALPAEQILIETDSYPLPGRRTEPRDLVPVGVLLAELRGWSVETCAVRLWQNAASAFALPDAVPVAGRN